MPDAKDINDNSVWDDMREFYPALNFDPDMFNHLYKLGDSLPLNQYPNESSLRANIEEERFKPDMNTSSGTTVEDKPITWDKLLELSDELDKMNKPRHIKVECKFIERDSEMLSEWLAMMGAGIGVGGTTRGVEPLRNKVVNNSRYGAFGGKSLLGLKIIEDDTLPMYTQNIILSDDVDVSPEFRTEFNQWLKDRFGGETYIIHDTMNGAMIMHSEVAKHFKGD